MLNNANRHGGLDVKQTTLFALTALLGAVAFLRIPAAAQQEEDPAANLEGASYISAHDVYAELPQGKLYIEEGVVAIFPNLHRRMGGLFIGTAEVSLDSLNEGPGSLNLFSEIDPQQRVQKIDVRRAYLSTALTADAKIIPSGYTTAIREWGDLNKKEQAAFREIYLQSMSDAWVDNAGGGAYGGHMAGSGGGSGLTMRFPKAKEFFLAMWEKDGTRYDYRTDATGTQTLISDYTRGIDFYRAPWAPEEADPDDGIDFQSIGYTYFFTAAAGETPGRVQLAIDARLSVESDRAVLNLASYPWLAFSSIKDGQGSEYRFKRGGIGRSDWQLSVEGNFSAGEEYQLLLYADCDVPDSYSGIGYGGAYRFDTAALWPGEDSPTDISISVQSADPALKVVAASDGHSVTAIGDGAVYSWKDSTRSQMLVATAFPMRELSAAWGSIEVYAPAALIDGVEELGYVASLDEMISFFSDSWGEFGPRDADGQHRLRVFLLPDEEGVQAFEDAGFVFILGSRSGIPLVAHEVAHIWWGQGFSGPRWFQEGMANYAAAKFLEAHGAAFDEDPLSYRRYLVNFGLAHELPLSLPRRDELDDSAAIYHNSAGFLLTLDERLSGGLDPVLKRMYSEHAFAPAISDDAELGNMLSSGDAAAATLFDNYVMRGKYDDAPADDDTFREMVHTPSRDSYGNLLGWLNPTYRKMGMGDYEGALYCATRALEYRSEPKDRYLVADLTLLGGDDRAAEKLAWELLESEDETISVKAYWLLARIHREQNHPDEERSALSTLIERGPALGLMREVQQATERLAELDGK
jgi:tetratricopeptide (TPR) repeat protein